MPRTPSPRAARSVDAAQAEVVVPNKLYFRIGEVSKLTRTKAYVLRFWETEFPKLRPMKSKSGHRLYRRRDVEMVLEIKRLLYGKGYTISGARKYLAGGLRGESAQQHLFQATLNTSELGAIRQELQSILTMLSRKC